MAWGMRAWGARSWAGGGTDTTPSGSLTATGDAANARVQLALTWTGASYATIYRVLGAVITPVRTAAPVELVSGAITVYDYEVPLDTSVYYIATSPGLFFQQLTSASVTVASSDQTWLGHPILTSLNRTITVTVQPERARDIDRGVFPVIGRTRPVVVTSGVRQAPAGTLELYVSTVAERDGLLSLVADGSALLMRTPASYGWDASTWIAVGKVTETPTSDKGFWPMRLITMEYTEVDAPALANPTGIVP